MVTQKLDSPYTVAIKTWDGTDVVLEKACRVALATGEVWRDMRQELDLKIGKSNLVVKFDKIRSIHFLKRGERTARLMTTSGKTYDVTMSNPHVWWGSDWIAGNLEKYGPARISVSDVSAMQVYLTSKTPEKQKQ